MRRARRPLPATACGGLITMLPILLSACILVAATVALHAAGLALLLRALVKRAPGSPAGIARIARLLIRATWALIFLHLAEIAVWGAFYYFAGCLPDAESSFYFAGVTYTTVGYGDMVLPKPWRMLGPIEGLTGILMCGLSTGFLFAVMHRLMVPPRDTKDA